jgi:hypothetical protein
LDPKAELKAMLESVAESTLDRIDQYGWAIPVCLAHTHAGENFYVLYDDSEADDNDPYDHQAARESILRQVRAYIAEGRFRAIAFARVVHITVDSDKGPVETDAVKILLDHEEGQGYTAYLTFHSEQGKARPDDIIYQELAEPFF